MIDLDPSGRVSRVGQALTTENFARIRVGIDRQEDVLRLLGPPRMKQQYARTEFIAWLYGYKQDGVWDSEMAIYFDSAGVVRELQNGPDPRFLMNGRDRSK